MDKINWVEAFAIDPRTNKKCYTRVNEDDFDPKEKAFYEAYKRALVVAYRGYKGEKLNIDYLKLQKCI